MKQQIIGGKFTDQVCSAGKELNIWIFILRVETAMLNIEPFIIGLLVINWMIGSAIVKL